MTSCLLWGGRERELGRESYYLGLFDISEEFAEFGLEVC